MGRDIFLSFNFPVVTRSKEKREYRAYWYYFFKNVILQLAFWLEFWNAYSLPQNVMTDKDSSVILPFVPYILQYIFVSLFSILSLIKNIHLCTILIPLFFLLPVFWVIFRAVVLGATINILTLNNLVHFIFSTKTLLLYSFILSILS